LPEKNLATMINHSRIQVMAASGHQAASFLPKKHMPGTGQGSSNSSGNCYALSETTVCSDVKRLAGY
jgi:hypothetical protein